METLQIQEEITKNIATYIAKQNENYGAAAIGKNKHYHLCTFWMTTKNWIEQCEKWRASHPVRFLDSFAPLPDSIYEYCDFCPMMNYVALDDEGKLMYAIRNLTSN